MSLMTVVSNGVLIFMLWLFASAGVSKLRPGHRDYYQGVVAQYGVAVPALARSLVLLLGLVEISVGLCLLLPATRMAAAVVGAVLLAVYLISMWRQLAQGRADMDCGCSGPAAAVKLSPALLWRNGIYLLLLLCSGIPSATAVDIATVMDSTPVVNSAAVVDSAAAWSFALLLGATLALLSACAEQLIGSSQKLANLN